MQVARHAACNYQRPRHQRTYRDGHLVRYNRKAAWMMVPAKVTLMKKSCHEVHYFQSLFIKNGKFFEEKICINFFRLEDGPERRFRYFRTSRVFIFNFCPLIGWFSISKFWNIGSQIFMALSRVWSLNLGRQHATVGHARSGHSYKLEIKSGPENQKDLIPNSGMKEFWLFSMKLSVYYKYMHFHRVYTSLPKYRFILGQSSFQSFEFFTSYPAYNMRFLFVKKNFH